MAMDRSYSDTESIFTMETCQGKISLKISLKIFKIFLMCCIAIRAQSYLNLKELGAIQIIHVKFLDYFRPLPPPMSHSVLFANTPPP